MMNPNERREQPTSTEKTWAIVRTALGWVQMFGAIVAFSLLIQTGVTSLALTAVVITCVFTTVSVLLFGRRKE